MDKTNLQSTHEKPQDNSVKKNVNTGNTTMIKVVGSSGKTVSFEMNKDTLMRSALDAYAKKVGKESHTIRFRWAGVWISSSDTPGTLNMKDNVVRKSSQTELFNSTTPSDPSWSRDASPSLSDLEREEEKEKQVAEEQKKVFEARMDNLKKRRERAEEKERLRKEAEEEVKARKLAEEKAQKWAEEKVRKEAEEKARKKAEDKARKQAEDKVRKEAEEKARKKAEDKARKQAQEKVRKEAEEKARKTAEDKARTLAEDKARKQAENKAREEKAQELAAEQAQREEENKTQKRATEQTQREAKESKRRMAEEWKRVKSEEQLQREDEKVNQQDVKSKGEKLAQDEQHGRQASLIWGTLCDCSRHIFAPGKLQFSLRNILSTYIRATEDDPFPTPPDAVGVKKSESSANSSFKDTESEEYDELADKDPEARPSAARVLTDKDPEARPPAARARVYCSWSTRTRRTKKNRLEESTVEGSFVINAEQHLAVIESKMARVVDQQQEILDLLSNSHKKLKKVRSHERNLSEPSGGKETDD
ncbi:hypothetical protein F5876DRAFT_68892 [Lentinula aff. lateritia]|uniref:Uncharacterized protein n=1 Tax=Lentinula aff. lateritia TaxID=2804960 RepID=A0ACC1TP60_9AGAR|nr:hypothetical protein F5876DRAFT_68892 [Lentinula aff. lateritia]